MDELLHSLEGQKELIRIILSQIEQIEIESSLETGYKLRAIHLQLNALKNSQDMALDHVADELPKHSLSMTY